VANPGDMDHAEAEAIYDSGRDACVKVLLALANQVERLEGRVERLEGEVRELRRDSGNSSLPPSVDPGAGKRERKANAPIATPALSPATPAQVAGCCRSSRLMRRSSTCLRAVGSAVARSPTSRREAPSAATR
jgi:hypothetical protein